MNSGRIRLLIVDDDQVMLVKVAEMVDKRNGIEVVATVSNGAEAIKELTLNPVDVALVDVDMPEVDGIGVLKFVVSQLPQVKVIMFTAFQIERNLQRAMAAGARGFLTKTVNSDDLVAAIVKVAAGQIVMGEWSIGVMTNQLIKDEINRAEYSDFIARVNELTPSLRDVFELVILAYSNRQIASSLHLGEDSVRQYVTQVFRHTGVRSRGELILRAKNAGF